MFQHNILLFSLLNEVSLSWKTIKKHISSFQLFCWGSDEPKQYDNQFHQQHCCLNSSSTILGHTPGCDFEGLTDKYWGEILERTLSSTSLQTLQRAYSHPTMDKCNGGLQEMTVFDTAVPDL